MPNYNEVADWEQNKKIQVQGHNDIKTVTRTCKLKDGSDKVLTQTFKRFVNNLTGNDEFG